MTGFLRLFPKVVLAVAAALVIGAGPARATDDYTLPFYDPDISLSYGVDRDPRVGVQLDYTGKTWWDDDPHYGRVYDNHTGLDYPMPLFSPVAASNEGVVAATQGGFGTQEFGDFGNFVRIRHGDGRHTLYYHLASRDDGGILVGYDDDVAAGQKIARSGCSGRCFGAHLHFEVLVSRDDDLVTTDPMFHRLWTTWPGRVPFLATYVRENDSGTVYVQQGHTTTHWVEFRNKGGRSWRPGIWPGRTVLGTWDPATHASPFEAADWSSSWLATRVDATTSPDEVGRFTFGIRGGLPPGSYDETFNLFAQAIRWFDHAALGGFHIPIRVIRNVSP